MHTYRGETVFEVPSDNLSQKGDCKIIYLIIFYISNCFLYKFIRSSEGTYRNYKFYVKHVTCQYLEYNSNLEKALANLFFE